MKSPSKAAQPLEFWLLENVFQRFSDYTYARLGLTNFFWAVCSFIVACLSYLWTAYVGIVFEHDPLMILAMFVMVAAFLFPGLRMIKKAWYQGYDDAIYGVENILKIEHAALRAEALIFTAGVTILWAIIAIHHGKPHLNMLAMWISMMQYPTMSFCSCTPPGRRIR